jgi:hypothetical protein
MLKESDLMIFWNQVYIDFRLMNSTGKTKGK